ncbi:hypothetical protein HY990_01450 [Candidatus Micrarchaeota archaeon]|nr:hypothetical protein [Candidatus Micrarchaeota archaeon]
MTIDRILTEIEKSRESFEENVDKNKLKELEDKIAAYYKKLEQIDQEYLSYVNWTISIKNNGEIRNKTANQRLILTYWIICRSSIDMCIRDIYLLLTNGRIHACNSILRTLVEHGASLREIKISPKKVETLLILTDRVKISEINDIRLQEKIRKQFVSLRLTLKQLAKNFETDKKTCTFLLFMENNLSQTVHPNLNGKIDLHFNTEGDNLDNYNQFIDLFIRTLEFTIVEIEKNWRETYGEIETQIKEEKGRNRNITH